jgi:hypothetical protein
VAPGTPGTSTFKAKCFEIFGTATNPGKEELRNADVYGLVIGARARRIPLALLRRTQNAGCVRVVVVVQRLVC